MCPFSREKVNKGKVANGGSYPSYFSNEWRVSRERMRKKEKERLKRTWVTEVGLILLNR